MGAPLNLGGNYHNISIKYTTTLDWVQFGIPSQCISTVLIEMSVNQKFDARQK